MHVEMAPAPTRRPGRGVLSPEVSRVARGWHLHQHGARITVPYRTVPRLQVNSLTAIIDKSRGYLPVTYIDSPPLRRASANKICVKKEW